MSSDSAIHGFDRFRSQVYTVAMFREATLVSRRFHGRGCCGLQRIVQVNSQLAWGKNYQPPAGRYTLRANRKRRCKPTESPESHTLRTASGTALDGTVWQFPGNRYERKITGSPPTGRVHQTPPLSRDVRRVAGRAPQDPRPRRHFVSPARGTPANRWTR